jgi:transposase
MDKFYYIGIDIAKAKFDVAVLINGKVKSKVFNNHIEGFGELTFWLESLSVHQAHFCMEATGVYWEQVAEYLSEQKHRVSVVNPAVIANYAKALMQRGKTDEQDAKVIARYCEREQPAAWIAPPKEQRQLKAMMRQLEHLKHNHQKEACRLQTTDVTVQKFIKKHIKFLANQIASLEEDIEMLIANNPVLCHNSSLLKSIPGVGAKTTPWLLAYLGDGSRFNRGKEAAAYAGLSPVPYLSGSSVRGKTRISKKGHNDLRQILYMPAMATYGKRRAFVPFINRLLESGKRPKEVIVALMRKIITIAQAVLKSQQPFNAEIHAK